MIRSVRVAIVASAFLLSGCLGDPIYGISSWGHFPATVDPACVTAALRGTPGVTDVKFGRSRAATDQEPAAPIGLRWSYRSGEYVWPLGIEVETDGSIRYFNQLTHMGTRIPAEELRAFEPVMLAINQHIERDCNIPLSGNVEITHR